MVNGTILYSNGCPRCEVLKKKLDSKNVHYVEDNSVDTMLALGITQTPALSVDGKLMGFSEAVAWVNSLKGVD